ncbi:aldehyde oxidase GLOX [Amborella trichopoda]|uniref:Galactose oxidase-like Early set domain-containing protein n=1 Tax=Amborella trichopoda TaxID=13333 RepID=U5D0W8_AMBTC|nr:aldehyde oxidase GLOX [Amborella trichopoda]ERN19271.1 hypothetical protein AMTR_s00061p00216590 [Amborella trichopoda]|eukprot:XP_006857804.1 aldehyde oxidase GLOX [Amborella trichopoda]
MGDGHWDLLVSDAGVSAMHMTTTRLGTVVMFDGTYFGTSKLPLGHSRCHDRATDVALPRDCWAHSIEYDPAANSVRPLTILTDTLCSSGAFLPNGTLIQTGGFQDGEKGLRLFHPCLGSACDWNEVSSPPSQLSEKRWYSTNQVLPDHRVIVVGGTTAFTYEFVPKPSGSEGSFRLPFLIETNDPIVENNLYPFLHLCPDGSLYVFANKDSILFDYNRGTVIRKFPPIPEGPRNYPSSGASVMLPLSAANGFTRMEVLICGGARDGAAKAARGAKDLWLALNSCGRMEITSPNPHWIVEKMPIPRVMGDMILLPDGNVLIINGAQNGVAGWELGSDPCPFPLLYQPESIDKASRFLKLAASKTLRMYHSTANLMTDARVLIGGSNPHEKYTFEGPNVKFPTELSLEAFSPPYLDPSNAFLRPDIMSVPTEPISYGASFTVEFRLPGKSGKLVEFNLYAPSFTTHSNSMNQRLVKLTSSVPVEVGGGYKSIVVAPPRPAIAPPGYYMLFVVNGGVPSVARWVRFLNGLG